MYEQRNQHQNYNQHEQRIENLYVPQMRNDQDQEQIQGYGNVGVAATPGFDNGYPTQNNNVPYVVNIHPSYRPPIYGNRIDHVKSRLSCHCCSDVVKNVARTFLSEFLATFMLLFLGCSGLWFQPVTFGVAIVTATQIFGDISGAHMNPAVTLAAAITGTGRLKSIFYIPVYIIGQFFGGLLGYGLFHLMGAYGTAFETMCLMNPPRKLQIGQGGTYYNHGLAVTGHLFGYEFLMSFIYVMAMCALWEHDKRMNGDATMPLKRGLIYTGIILCFFLVVQVPISLNPMRALIPTLVHGSKYDGMDYQWIYWIAPLLGSLVGSLFYSILRVKNKQN